jgi:hypothetical protein
LIKTRYGGKLIIEEPVTQGFFSFCFGKYADKTKIRTYVEMEKKGKKEINRELVTVQYTWTQGVCCVVFLLAQE